MVVSNNLTSWTCERSVVTDYECLAPCLLRRGGLSQWELWCHPAPWPFSRVWLWPDSVAVAGVPEDCDSLAASDPRARVSAPVDSFPQVPAGCLLCWHRTRRGFKESKAYLCSHNHWPLLVKDGYSYLIPAKKENFFLTILTVSLYRKQLQERAVLSVSQPSSADECVPSRSLGAVQSAALGAAGGCLDADCNSLGPGWADVIRISSHKQGRCLWVKVFWNSLGHRLHFFASGVSCPCLGPLMAPRVAGWNPESSSQQLVPSPGAESIFPASPHSCAAMCSKASVLLSIFSLPGWTSLPSRLRRYQSRAHLFCDTSSHLTAGSMFSSLDHLAPCSTLQGTICPLTKSRTSQGLSLFQGKFTELIHDSPSINDCRIIEKMLLSS